MFEAYSVAVRISLINGVSSGLIKMARQFRSTELAAAGVRKELKAIGGLMLVGGGLTAAGLGIFAGLEKIANQGKEYANQLALMNTLGMKQADIAAAVGQAWRTAYDVPTSKIEGNLKSFRELRSVFGVGHEGEASAMLPIVAKINGIMTALTGKEQDKVGFDLVKATELRTGVMTMAALQRNASLMSQAIIGLGGTITVADFHGALKMGKMATNKWSDDFTYNYLPTLMQEMKTAPGGGAQSAGTALMSFYQQAHGRMTKAAMPYWEMGGLVQPKDIVRNAGGQWQVRPGGIKDTAGLESNPFAWVQNDLRPAIAKIMDKMHVSAETAINAMFSNRNAAFAAYNMYVKAAQYERDKKTIGQADDYNGYQKLLKTSPQFAEMALANQWHNLMATMGYQILPDVIRAMQALMPVIRDFTEWVNKNPGAMRAWARGFAALGAALVLAGGLTLFTGVIRSISLVAKLFGAGGAVASAATGAARFLPLFAGGIRVVGTAIGALGAIPFAPIAAGLTALSAVIWGLDAISKARPSYDNPGGGRGAAGHATVKGGGGSPYVHNGYRDNTDRQGNVYMDGHLVGKIINGHLVRSMSGPSSGPSRFDMTRTYTPVGMP